MARQCTQKFNCVVHQRSHVLSGSGSARRCTRCRRATHFPVLPVMGNFALWVSCLLVQCCFLKVSGLWNILKRQEDSPSTLHVPVTAAHGRYSVAVSMVLITPISPDFFLSNRRIIFFSLPNLIFHLPFLPVQVGTQLRDPRVTSAMASLCTCEIVALNVSKASC
jgi:hypothetical protein